jgi:cytolysin (calcineurin-like family phosphatase)
MIHARVRVAAPLFALAVSSSAGCGSSGDTPGATGDASTVDVSSPTNDGGTTAHDAGTHPNDASVPPPDSGVVADSGGHEAGPPADSGSDAGSHPTHFDITFIVMADSHADPVPEDDLLSQVRAINAVSKTGVWPATIGGNATHFLGGPIASPQGVVICGDLTGWGTAPTEIPMFQSYFEKGNSANSINYPAYVGVGNHDIDSADRDPTTAAAYRATYWQYIDARYKGPQAPVPVTNFDPQSHSYSWDWAGVHLVMNHRFAGDTEYGLPSSLPWLAADLKQYASDGRPVFLFHHYGMDSFGTDGQWWNAADRYNYRTLLTGYHVTADIVGHTHYAFAYTWDGLNVQQVNNAKAEINTGNNDGNGSFAVVRVTDKQFDLVTARWTNDQGGFELIEPYFSGPSDPGAAPPTTLVPSGGFATSCSNISLSGSSLSATCQVGSQGQATTVDLNGCVTNNNGNLQFATPGNYSGSCSGCSLSGTNLTCQCNPMSGPAKSTTIDINNDVSNCGGTLKCGPC